MRIQLILLGLCTFVNYSTFALMRSYLYNFGRRKRGPWFEKYDGIPVKIQPINHSNPTVWPIGNQTIKNKTQE